MVHRNEKKGKKEQEIQKTGDRYVGIHNDINKNYES